MSDQNGYVQFVNDERGYLRWLEENPRGYVVNSLRSPTANYLKLHLASCKHINKGFENDWTTGDFIKTCSTDPAALDGWAMEATGSGVDPCGACKPAYRPGAGASSPRIEVAAERPAPSLRPASLIHAPAPPPSIRSIPPKISTGCPELDRAWASYSSMILHSEIPIPDTDNDLNWHAFLGHSIDMHGFRAAEFAGVDPLTRKAPDFVPLKRRGIGVPELASLWQVTAIREHLQGGRWDEYLRPETLAVLRGDGGVLGRSLADAFEQFPWTKYRWSVRALLQNSDKLRPFDFSFRNWLRAECARLAVGSFPPPDFGAKLPVGWRPSTIEQAIRERLDAEFYMVGTAMSAYMICDWQLWLWREGRTAVFSTFKLDRFHEKFVAKFGRGLIPADETGFARWWFELYPDLPPRLANECIWLAVESKQVDLR